MSETFHILNAKKMFGQFHWNPLISKTGADKLKEDVKKNWSNITKKDQDKWTELFNIFDTLPVHDAWMSGQAGYGSCQAIVLGNISSFVSKSPDLSKYPSDINKWGWEHADKLASLMSMVERYMDSSGLSKKINFSAGAARSAKKNKQRFESGELVLEAFDPVLALAETSACAVFIPSKNGGGYLDGRGEVSPLAGARLFETSGSAYTTIRSRGLRSAMVVHVKTNLTHIDPNTDTSYLDHSSLAGAISIVEKKAIEKALEEASLEQLLARLEILQAGTIVEEKPVAQKKRM